MAKNAQPGEMISPMSAGGFTRTGIGTIVDMASLEVEVDVNEAYINRVKPGQRVVATLDAYPDWQIPASVIIAVPTAEVDDLALLGEPTPGSIAPITIRRLSLDESCDGSATTSARSGLPTIT